MAHFMVRRTLLLLLTMLVTSIIIFGLTQLLPGDIARLMLGLKTHDCTGGFRCFRREMLLQIPWEEIRLQGYGFQIGTTYQVERLGGRVVEFPIIFEDRRVGQSKMSFKIVVEAFTYVTQTALSGRSGRLAWSTHDKRRQ